MRPAVLVVDDDEAIRDALRFLLEDEGYTVHEAPDGLDALALLRTATAPMVVLLDLMMPRLDGAGVLGIVANNQHLARHAFVLITANDKTIRLSFAKLLTNLGVRVVPKPFDLDTVLAIVGQVAAGLAS